MGSERRLEDQIKQAFIPTQGRTFSFRRSYIAPVSRGHAQSVACRLNCEALFARVLQLQQGVHPARRKKAVPFLVVYLHLLHGLSSTPSWLGTCGQRWTEQRQTEFLQAQHRSRTYDGSCKKGFQKSTCYVKKEQHLRICISKCCSGSHR